MADDTDLASVLATVLSTAQRHNFGTVTTSGAKSPSSTTTSSSDSTKTQNAIELPSACKMKILSYLAPQQKVCYHLTSHHTCVSKGNKFGSWHQPESQPLIVIGESTEGERG